MFYWGRQTTNKWIHKITMFINICLGLLAFYCYEGEEMVNFILNFPKVTIYH